MILNLIKSDPLFKRHPTYNGTYINISELFCSTLQGEGFYSGSPATFIRLKDCTLDCHWCFDGRTKIVKVKGTDKISDLVKGDKLITISDDGKIVETTVERLIKSSAYISELLSINFDSGTGEGSQSIISTNNHLFNIKNKGFVRADKISVGDVVLGATGKQVVSYKMTNYNSQFNADSIHKRLATQSEMRRNGIIKPYFRTDKHKSNMSLLKSGDSNVMKNPEVAKRNAESHKKRASGLELKLIKIATDLGLPLIYTGNNVKAIGSKDLRYRFPDFVVDGAMKLIEVYDTTYKYAVGKDGCREYRGSEWIDKTISHYNKFGYEVMFVTDKDLKDEDSIKESLINYIYNGSTVTSIGFLSNKQKARLYGKSDVVSTDVYNLKCSPYNTYMISGRGSHKHVHNCDTTEVWRFGNSYGITEILDMFENNGMIPKFHEGQHLILTGGSPLLQQDALIEFIKSFVKRFLFKPFIEVENECTRMPRPELSMYIDCWNNSPKLANSGMKERVRYKADIIHHTARLSNSWFKFVVSKEDDWNEINKYFIEPQLISKKQIILMPEGQTREELQAHYDVAVNMAVDNGVRFSDRMHVTIWNKKTGV